MRYVSRPVEVEARQWVEGSFRERRADPNIWRASEIVAWVNRNGGEAWYEPELPAKSVTLATQYRPARIAVRTTDGWAYAAPSHYVVMGDATFQDGGFMRPARFIRNFYPVSKLSEIRIEHEWEAKP